MKLDELVPLGEATPFPDEETARLAAALAQASLRLNGYAAHGHLVHYPPILAGGDPGRWDQPGARVSVKRAQLRAQLAAVRRGKTFRRRRPAKPRPSFWSDGEFIALDGEGFSDGPPFEVTIKGSGSRYTGRGHHYAYLATSDGRELWAPTGRLRMLDCLNLICEAQAAGPLRRLVAFGASYDVTHMVAHDLARAQLAQLVGVGQVKARPVVVTDPERGWTYTLEYRPRKVFTVRRWEIGAKRYAAGPDGKRRMTPHLTAQLWDVWGFFQESFVTVMAKWCPEDPDFAFVRRMKGDRSIFERSEIAEVRRYNAAELRVLVKVMNRVRDAIRDLGLTINRWDGAGAIAAAMLTKEGVKAHKADLPDPVFEAARRAYSGGHIEACKVGFHQGQVFHYDVNSAYPAAFAQLPSLAGASWRSGEGTPPEGYTLVKLAFDFPAGLPFYPLFYRTEAGAILYPRSGVGWYWWPEYQVAMRFAARFGGRLVASSWWTLNGSKDRPFAWVRTYYGARAAYVEAAKAGGYQSGPEKVIKTGINALYGKTAQQLGARRVEGELHAPPFFQLDWAGWVTSWCRAKLMEAASQDPAAVIMFATDGLFTTRPLDLDAPAAKVLGAWEAKRHDGITVVMPGVYWLHDGAEVARFSRGFDKEAMADPQLVHQAWAAARGRRRRHGYQYAMGVNLRRLIGISSAVLSDDLWPIRGCFADSPRSLELDGDNSKRHPIDVARARPQLGLVDTVPRDPDFSNWLLPPESAPYPVAWIDGDLAVDEVEGEMADEREALDAELA